MLLNEEMNKNRMIDQLARALDDGAVIVKVKPSKRESRIVSSDPFTIELKAKPIEGAANDELLRYLKEHVGPGRITSGHASRTKRIERQSAQPRAQ